MSGAVAVRDPGPMARFRDLIADETAPGIIFQRVCEGKTLRELARDYSVPKGEFTRWFTTQHSELYDAALKVRADDLAHEALAISDEQAQVTTERGTTFDPDVSRDKLRVETRLKLVQQWDRARYGAKDTGPSGGVTVIVDRSCGGTVEVTAPGGSVARIGISGPEASAIPAAGSLEKLEI